MTKDAPAARTAQTVLVTGGSRGLGLAIARKLSAQGYSVVAVGRTQSDGLRVAMEESAAPVLYDDYR